MEAPSVPFPPTIPDVLREAVASWGDRDFVVTPDRRMTYADAELASRRLAKQMLAAGIGKGTRVGLCFPYGQDWVVAWLAASRLGALVMPLATTYRPAEIRTVLRIGDVDTLLTARSVLGRDMQDMLEAAVPDLAAATSARLFLPDAPYLRAVWMTGPIDRAWATPVDFDALPAAAAAIGDDLVRAVEREVVPGDLAQVTYTSGSSAEPKGVVHTHGTVVRATARIGRVAERRRAAALLLRIPVLLDRRHAGARRRAAVGGDGSVHRAVRAGRRPRPHRTRAGDARARMADAAAVDA